MGLMIALYCRKMHRGGAALCADCAALAEYAYRRIDHCPYGPEKPVCSRCAVHCYRPGMRDSIRRVMRFAGPRMLLRHPILAVGHLLRKRRGAARPPERGRSAG